MAAPRLCGKRPARFAARAFSCAGSRMQLTPQHGTAVVETDHALSEREHRRILADLQSIGLRAIILPVGVTLSHVAQGCLDEDED